MASFHAPMSEATGTIIARLFPDETDKGVGSAARLMGVSNMLKSTLGETRNAGMTAPTWDQLLQLISMSLKI